MTSVYHSLADILLELQQALIAIEYWSDEEPALARLQSREPFCIDTLSFPEWLQFIFIPKMSVIIENQQVLPTTSAIYPMAEVFTKDQNFCPKPLLSVLSRYDELINHGNIPRNDSTKSINTIN